MDLAHAVALNLPPEVARRWEAQLLESYVLGLNEAGVSRSLGETCERYRQGVLYAVTVPIRQWAAGVPEDTWLRLFRNVLVVARELGAESLL